MSSFTPTMDRDGNRQPMSSVASFLATKRITFVAGTTGTNGGVLTNLYNTASSALSGTNVDIKILIGTVPYYFTVYPTKA